MPVNKDLANAVITEQFLLISKTSVMSKDGESVDLR